MYDSAAETLTRKHTEILKVCRDYLPQPVRLTCQKRIRRAVEYEHSQHYHKAAAFPAEWGANQIKYFDTTVMLYITTLCLKLTQN